MNTRFWGPSGWEFLHTLTAIYPETPTMEDKLIMRDFMMLICDILPCKYCRASFTKYMANLDVTPALESRDLLIEWLYKMHNKVNKKLRIQGFCHNENPTIEHVYKLYELHQTAIIKILKSKYNCKLFIINNNIIKYICKIVDFHDTTH